MQGYSPWHSRYSGPPPDKAELEALAARLEISPSFAALLWRRGFHDLTDMSRFLAPNLRNLALPVEWPDFVAGAQVILEALDQGRSMLVWGD